MKELYCSIKGIQKLQTELKSVTEENVQANEAKTQAEKQVEISQRLVTEARECVCMTIEETMSLELRKLPIDLHRFGARVRVNFAGRGHLYPATITSKNEDGSFLVTYLDGDKEDNVPRTRIVVV